jgi:hypothetical protein
MKKYIYLSLLLTIQGCTSYIKGDLASKNLSDHTLPLQIAHLEEKNIGQKSFLFSMKKELAESLSSSAGKIIPPEEYTLVVDYDVSPSLSDAVMPWVTMVTLGVIPLYSTGNVDTKVQMIRGKSLVYKAEIDSRTHTFYGWWALFHGAKRQSPDRIKYPEPARPNMLKHKAVRERIERRISKLMEDPPVYNQIMR